MRGTHPRSVRPSEVPPRTKRTLPPQSPPRNGHRHAGNSFSQTENSFGRPEIYFRSTEIDFSTLKNSFWRSKSLFGVPESVSRAPKSISGTSKRLFDASDTLPAVRESISGCRWRGCWVATIVCPTRSAPRSGCRRHPSSCADRAGPGLMRRGILGLGKARATSRSEGICKERATQPGPERTAASG